MTNLYDMFGTEKSHETDGIWYAFSEETKFLLARAGGANVRFGKAVEAKFRPYRRQVDNKSIDPDLATKLMVEVFADVIVLDWEGVKDADGEDMEYSNANVVKLFTDLPDLFEEIQAEATRLSNFQSEELEADIKN